MKPRHLSYVRRFSVTLLLAVAVVFNPGISLSQGLPYAMWENQGTGAYWFVRLDATTGLKNNIALVPGMTAFVAGGSAFNTHLNRYHTAGLMGNVVHYFTIDAATGNVVFSPPLQGVVTGVEYNCGDSALYAVRILGNNYELVTLDPSSGMLTAIAPMTGFSAYVAESFAIDLHQGLYTLIVQSGNVRFLRAYDLVTGSLVYNNPFMDNLTGIRYSCADSSLFGLWENGGVYKLERIHLATGSHVTVAALAGVTPGFVAGSASVGAGGDYTYRGFDAANMISLIRIDLTTGMASSSASSDNAVGFEEAMCCLPSAVSVFDSPVAELSPLFYPVPIGDLLFIACANPVARVEVFDVTGRKALWLVDRQKSFSLDMRNVAPGVCLVRLTGDQGFSYSGKAIKH